MSTNSNMRFGVSNSVTGRNTVRDLRSMGWFAKWPLIGLTMFLIGMLVFGGLAYGIETNTALLQWDTATARTFHTDVLNVPAPLVEYLIFGFFVGREIVILLSIALGIYFLYKRFWREFAMVLLGPGVGGLLWYFLSRFFDRPRPPTQLDVILSDPSFPSGHALSAVVFYGLLAYLLVPRMPSRFWKWFVVITLALVTAFIGFSRLILGGHYVTDVIAGYALGIAWAGLIYTVVERFFPKSVSANEAGGTSSTAEGLRAPGLFKQKPWLGVLLVVLGSLSFAVLGYALLSHSPLLQLDQSIYETLITKSKAAPPRINELMIFGFFLGKQVVMLVVTVLTLYFLYKRYWRELAMLWISSAGGSFVWNFFVSYFSRPRPAEQTGLAVTAIPSFPSGHAMSAMIGYGFLAYLLVPRMPSRFWKWTFGVFMLLLILFDGFSRIFQGSHYFSDVLAGYALGIAWAALVYTVIETIFIRRKV